MKTIKNILAVLAFILVAACSKNDDATPISNLAISGINPTSGPKNTTVFITGVDFSTNAVSNIVTLNGKACTVNTASATSLSITIPRGAGSGKISVSVNGTTAQSPNFDYQITPSVVSTMAGSTAGFADGTGTSAKFNSLSCGVFDAVGNYYVTDFSNYKIRKITPAGVVSTLAGSTNGFADGTGAVAKFSKIYGIGIDATGNLYVADGNRIRKITPTGDVTTFAGSATAGAADGTGTAATFNSLCGLCLDTVGNIYVSDQGNFRIRKITSAGVVTTLAGSTQGDADGLATAAKFQILAGICVDVMGNLFVTEVKNGVNSKIKKISPVGSVTTVAGSTVGYADGAANVAKFDIPLGICVDRDNNLYVIGDANNKIRKITPSGIVSTIAGTTAGFEDGPIATAKFDRSWGINISPSGNLYVADETNNRIRIITMD